MPKKIEYTPTRQLEEGDEVYLVGEGWKEIRDEEVKKALSRIEPIVIRNVCGCEECMDPNSSEYDVSFETATETYSIDDYDWSVIKVTQEAKDRPESKSKGVDKLFTKIQDQVANNLAEVLRLDVVDNDDLEQLHHLSQAITLYEADVCAGAFSEQIVKSAELLNAMMDLSEEE